MESSCTILPSDPGSNLHGLSSRGSRLDGVPEKPRRVPKSSELPSSCPLAEIFRFGPARQRGKAMLSSWKSYAYSELSYRPSCVQRKSSWCLPSY